MGELEHILLSLGEKLEREEVDILIKECCDPEDDDGFIPYERKKMENHNKNNTTLIFSIFEKSVCWPSSRNVRRLVIAECDIPKLIAIPIRETNSLTAGCSKFSVPF